MGEARNNRTSKKDLSNNVSLDALPTDERKDDIDNFIRSFDNSINNEKYNDLIKSPLRMFTDEKECLKCTSDNLQANKQPFFIASGEMGRLIVPEIFEKLSGYIYIFCGHMEKHLDEWAGDYIEHMQMFNEETTVFIRLLRDIARYYLKKSEDSTSDRASSIKYLQWARRLVQRANKMDKESGRELLGKIKDKLAALRLTEADQSDDDDQKESALTKVNQVDTSDFQSVFEYCAKNAVVR